MLTDLATLKSYLDFIYFKITLKNFHSPSFPYYVLRIPPSFMADWLLYVPHVLKFQNLILPIQFPYAILTGVYK